MSDRIPSPDGLAAVPASFPKPRRIARPKTADDLAVPRSQRRVIGAIFGAAILGVVALKVFTLRGIEREIFWGSYAILVGVYLLSRFLLASRYRPTPTLVVDDALPFVSVVVPAMNEEDAIEETLRHALGSAYPKDRFEVIAVNDGSTDGTLAAMQAVQRNHRDTLRIVSMENRGKRFAMAEGFMRSKGEIVVFVDSDSFVDPGAIRRMMDYFADERVGCVAGHTDVANAGRNVLTRMQSVRYYVAFKVVKASEALFGAVTCCSGCFSGYRRAAVKPVLDEWLNQTFADTVSTYGDDRSLTNHILATRWKALYAPDATASTIVPETVSKFMRQQLRWKKSWIRESLRAGRFMWKRHVLAAWAFYTGVLLTLMAPVVFLRYVIVRPAMGAGHPWMYAAGIVAMAVLFGLYHRMRRRSGDWVFGILYALFYSTVMIWQTPYALATLRDGKWGTR